MPNINLIAVRREEKKKLERIASQLFIGLALGAILGIIGMCRILLWPTRATLYGTLTPP